MRQLNNFGGSSMFIVKLNKSCLVTYLGIIFGVLAASFAFSKIAFSETNFMRYSLSFFSVIWCM